jgi:hypothetical protein
MKDQHKPADEQIDAEAAIDSRKPQEQSRPTTAKDSPQAAAKCECPPGCVGLPCCSSAALHTRQCF